MEFIEASAFTKYVYDYLSKDGYLGLQTHLLQYPEAGRVVPVPAVSEKSAGPSRAKEIENG